MSHPASRAVTDAVIGIVINTPGGVASADVAEKLGISNDHCRHVLWVARRNGLVDHVRACRVTLWGSIETVARMRAGFLASLTPSAAKKRQTRIDTRAGLRSPNRRGHRVVVSDAIVQRWVDASVPLPFALKAPRSVFDLGSSA